MKILTLLTLFTLAVYGYSENINYLLPINVGDSSMSDSTFYEKADVMPEIVGGIEALAKNIHYPESAKAEGIEGKVFVTAYINETGDVVKAEIEKGVDPSLDDAALSAVKKTKFTSAKKDGRNVVAKITIPVFFKLDGSKLMKN